MMNISNKKLKVKLKNGGNTLLGTPLDKPVSLSLQSNGDQRLVMDMMKVNRPTK
jgi:hypothetical protein